MFVMRMMVEEETIENRDRRWIWRFAVAGRLGVVVGEMSLLLLWRRVSVLRGEVMFWIVCGISVVAVSGVVVAVGGLDGVDDVVSDLPPPPLSPASARASAMQRETVSMVIPTAY